MDNSHQMKHTEDRLAGLYAKQKRTQLFGKLLFESQIYWLLNNLLVLWGELVLFTDNECLIAIITEPRLDTATMAARILSYFFFSFFRFSFFVVVAKLMKTIDAHIVHAFTLN